MTLTMRSVMGAPTLARSARQPSHVPAWVLAEARLVRALPPPRTGMLRQLAGLAIAWSLSIAAMAAFLAALASL